jgi:hypothetical protein
MDLAMAGGTGLSQSGKVDKSGNIEADLDHVEALPRANDETVEMKR